MIGLGLSVGKRILRYMIIAAIFGSLFTFGRALVSTAVGTANAPDSTAALSFGATLSEQLSGYADSLRNIGSRLGVATAAPQGARVIHVADGDTFDVRIDGATERVRIIGVDAPETVKRGTKVQCYGPAASSFTKGQLNDQRVTLVYDRERHDKYGRTLAYVQLHGYDFGATLLRRGYARTLSISPNTTRASDYSAIQRRAKRAGRGLWGSCA